MLRPGLERPRPILTLEMAGGKNWTEEQARVQSLLHEWEFTPATIAIDGTLDLDTIQESYEYDNLDFMPRENQTEVANLFTP